MKRTEWKKEPVLNFGENPLGTPQFSVAKEKNFHIYTENPPVPIGKPEIPLKYSESLMQAERKQVSSYKMLAKPSEGRAEVLHEILSLRNLFEESVSKARKQYLGKERKLFEMLPEEEINVLLATRPGILEIPTKISPSPLISPEPRFIDEYRNSQSLKASSYKKPLKEMNDSQGSGRNEPSISQRSEPLKIGSIESSVLKEKNIREKYEEIFHQKKHELIKKLENKLKKQVAENKELIDNYWQEKIKELEEKLNDPGTENNENFYEDLDWEIEAQRESIKNELENEIEDRIKAQYLQKRSALKPISVNKKERENNIIKFQAELDIELMQMMEEEKNCWNKEEILSVQETCRKKYKEEQEQMLMKKEKELKRQAEMEKQELINRLVRDTEEAVEEQIRKLGEDKEMREAKVNEMIKEECLQEIQMDNEQRYRELAKDKIKANVEKDLRKNLTHRIEMELKIRLEDLVYQEYNQSFEESHENFRKKIEQDHLSKVVELESQFESNLSTEILQNAEKRFMKTEKDLKINYLKKLDKLKSDLRKEFEEIYIGQIKKLKSLLIEEKSYAARIKSQINVYVNKTASEKNSQLRDLMLKEELLDRKIRDVSMRQQYEIEQSQQKFTPDTSKSPLRNQSSSMYSSSPLLIESELSKHIPRPLPPPELASLAEEVKRKSVSPERRLLKNYDTKEIVSQLIMKNYEEASKQAWTTLKETEEPTRPKSNYAEYAELLSTGKSVINMKETPKKHSLYNDLLKKKYGVIEPRNAK